MIMSTYTMKDVDHASPFADELTSVWHRGDEQAVGETDTASEPDDRTDRTKNVADD